MFSGLMLVLVPFLLGYLIKLQRPAWLALCQTILTLAVYLILFLMGVSLAQLDNLASHLQTILYSTAIVFACSFGLNFVVLMIIDRLLPWRIHDGFNDLPPRLKMILESLKICLALIIGFVIGLLELPIFAYASDVSEVTLILLLFVVGLQLRANGLSLRQILLNKVGLITSAIVMLSCLAGGLLAAYLLNLPQKMAMALTSSFGWYSLSSILMTDAYGPTIGSIAFFNDLLRELLAVLLIPSLIHRNRITALGLCGATSLDFTLPMLQRGGGISMVPPAIVQGFVLSVMVPILLSFLNL